MMERRRQILIGSGLIACLLAATFWGWGYLADQRAAALAAEDETADCRAMAGEIGRFRARSASVRSEPARQLDLTRRIARAAAVAGMSAHSLDRIEHDPPRRSPDGASSERPTRVLLRGATLRQTVAMLENLKEPAGGDGLRVGRLHLTAPDDSTVAAEAWDVEATLVQTVAAPKTSIMIPSLAN